MKKLLSLLLALVLILSLGMVNAGAAFSPRCGGFADADGDGVCDVCGGARPRDGSGRRGGRGAGFADLNGDGVCDNCGTVACRGRNR